MAVALLIALLIALLVYLPIGYAAVMEARHQPTYRPGDHRQWKKWEK